MKRKRLPFPGLIGAKHVESLRQLAPGSPLLYTAECHCPLVVVCQLVEDEDCQSSRIGSKTTGVGDAAVTKMMPSMLLRKSEGWRVRVDAVSMR